MLQDMSYYKIKKIDTLGIIIINTTYAIIEYIITEKNKYMIRNEERINRF